MPKVALKLLEQKEVKENAHATDTYGFDNVALRLACGRDMKEVAMELLKQPEVRNNLDEKNDKIQQYFSIWKDRGGSAEKQDISKLNIQEDAQSLIKTIDNKKGG